MIKITAAITTTGYIVSLDNVKASVISVEKGSGDAACVGAVVCEERNRDLSMLTKDL
jgi:hypothetical protein